MPSGLIKEQEMDEPLVNAVAPTQSAVTGMSTGRVTGAGNVAYSGPTVGRSNPGGSTSAKSTQRYIYGPDASTVKNRQR